MKRPQQPQQRQCRSSFRPFYDTYLLYSSSRKEQWKIRFQKLPLFVPPCFVGCWQTFSIENKISFFLPRRSWYEQSESVRSVYSTYVIFSQGLFFPPWKDIRHVLGTLFFSSSSFFFPEEEVNQILHQYGTDLSIFIDYFQYHPSFSLSPKKENWSVHDKNRLFEMIAFFFHHDELCFLIEEEQGIKIERRFLIDNKDENHQQEKTKWTSEKHDSSLFSFPGKEKDKDNDFTFLTEQRKRKQKNEIDKRMLWRRLVLY